MQRKHGTAPRHRTRGACGRSGRALRGGRRPGAFSTVLYPKVGAAVLGIKTWAATYILRRWGGQLEQTLLLALRAVERDSAYHRWC